MTDGDIYTRAAEGKYDHETAAMLEVLRAEAVLVVVKGGQLGDGFSVAIDGRKIAPERILDSIPRVLRSVADAIEEQARQKQGPTQ